MRGYIMMKIFCTISALVIVFTIMGCDVQPVPRQPSESQPGVVQEPIALPQDAPQAQDYYTQQGNVYPPQQQGMVYPQQQGMVYPQQQGVYPQQGMYPQQQQGMVYPQQQQGAYQSQLPVSQDAIELPLGVEPKPGMEIIQEPGQQPRLVYQNGTPVDGQQPYSPPQTGYPPVTSGPPAAGYQQNIQETPGTQGLETGVIYQQGPNGQLVPVPQNGDPNQTYQQYPQQYPQQPGQSVYPPGYAPQQQYPQQQIYYPPQQQGATMQKRDPSGQMVGQTGTGENMGYFSKPYGAPQGMYGQQPYYPPNPQENTGVSYPPVNSQGAN